MRVCVHVCVCLCVKVYRNPDVGCVCVCEADFSLVAFTKGYRLHFLSYVASLQTNTGVRLDPIHTHTHLLLSFVCACVWVRACVHACVCVCMGMVVCACVCGKEVEGERKISLIYSWELHHQSRYSLKDEKASL